MIISWTEGYKYMAFQARIKQVIVSSIEARLRCQTNLQLMRLASSGTNNQLVLHSSTGSCKLKSKAREVKLSETSVTNWHTQPE